MASSTVFAKVVGIGNGFVVGAAVVGFAVVGAAVVGFAVVGAAVVGVAVVGVSVVGVVVGVIVSPQAPKITKDDADNTKSVNKFFFIYLPLVENKLFFNLLIF